MGSEVRWPTPQSLLVGDRGCSVTFVVDASEDMRGILAAAKRLLIGTLLRKAAFRDSLFNIVAFSSQVTFWSNHMLPCAPHTLYLALAWIRSINCSAGSDLWGALSTALADPACEAVHLLCSGRPRWSEALLTALLRLAVGRPLNVFYLQSSAQQLAGDSLWQLALATGGRCYTIPVGSSGELKETLPCAAENGGQSPQTYSSLWSDRLSTPVFTPRTAPSAVLTGTVGNPYVTEVIPEFFPGCKVLARRKIDGFYYAGTVTQEVQACRGHWVVEFEPQEGTTPCALFCHRELVSSPDMVSSASGTPWCDLVVGDAVLSPWEPGVKRYGPGRVTAPSAGCRDGCGGGATSLRIQMWNRCVRLVPAHLVEPIPNSHYDRIVKELQITAPPSGQCCHWFRPPHCWSQPWTCHCCSGPHAPTQRLPTGCVTSFESTVGLQGPELEGQEVMKSDPEEASNSSSSSSSLSEQETSRRLPPVVKLKGGEQRPPWRYWRRTGAEPQHRQPGSVSVKRTPPLPPARFHLPVPPLSTSPNHSSLFQPLPGVAGRRANSRDAFGPHPRARAPAAEPAF